MNLQPFFWNWEEDLICLWRQARLLMIPIVLKSMDWVALSRLSSVKFVEKKAKWQTWLTTLNLTISRECKFCNQVYSSRSCTKVDIIHRISSLALTKCPTLILCRITCVCNHKHIRSWAKDWWSITSWWWTIFHGTVIGQSSPNCHRASDY